MGRKRRDVLRRRALRIDQNRAHPLYLFSLTGEELLSIADISRVSRNDAGKLLGYQRPEVKRHVRDIVEYLNEKDILFPNSFILALSSTVRFIRSRGPEVADGLAIAGVLEIPRTGSGQKKPAWIVDGQQRALALVQSKRRRFPIAVNAFVADDVPLQRDQFLRVNNARPLPRGLITELLPEVSSPPAHLAAKKIPSAVCDWLNKEAVSPFRGLIRRASTPKSARGRAIITDASVVKMVEESLTSANGCLFPYRNMATGETDFEGICAVLVTYWNGVKRVFPDSWGKPPARSRLMHGAGIRAMGRLMDRVMPSVNMRRASKSVEQVERELKRVAPVCRWTSGRWELLNGMRWNEILNVPKHISLLTNVLSRAYLQAKEARA